MGAFASTTANCARCHAHKFDPISQDDYYALQAVFAGLIEGDIPYDEDKTVGQARKRWQSLLAAAEAKDKTCSSLRRTRPSLPNGKRRRARR